MSKSEQYERASGTAVKEDSILVERDGAIGWIRINRPERLNAFAEDMREELDQALARLGEDPSVRCIVIMGVGRSFSTGGDVGAMGRLLEDDDTAGFEALVRTGAAIIRRIDQMETPVIAAVNGIAAGAGACLAIACDLRIASESASIGFGFMRVGLVPDWGGTYFLPRIVGASLAAEFFLTGEMISAERAERLGIFNRVVRSPELESSARAFAGQIAARPALAVRRTKQALRRTHRSSLEDMLEMEALAQVEAFRSPDAREGVTAFLEKRSPRFGS